MLTIKYQTAFKKDYKRIKKWEYIAIFFEMIDVEGVKSSEVPFTPFRI